MKAHISHIGKGTLLQIPRIFTDNKKTLSTTLCQYVWKHCMDRLQTKTSYCYMGRCRKHEFPISIKEIESINKTFSQRNLQAQITATVNLTNC